MSTDPHIQEPLPSPEEIEKLPPDGGEEFNRLIFEKSPYLLQHARNPVDWRPWGREAFDLAASENKPIMLSIGYSTCHWCHVMERESFENAQIAELINKHTVPVKVDREERPDLDRIYITAVQLMSGSGGWPMTVFLTPEGDPFAGGTYFPPEDRYGRRGMASLVPLIFTTYRDRPEEVRQMADRVRAAMERYLSEVPTEEAGSSTGLSRRSIAEALESIVDSFDPIEGGLRGTPKFPPHGALRLIFREHRRTPDNERLHPALVTLDRMALGGIRDHVGGGFHRYSTDAQWLVPHFEKMLYDNAQLLRAYVDGWRVSGNDFYRRVACRTADWIVDEMTHERGGFFSALDADSAGEEGLFYTWTWDEVHEVLGEEEAHLFCSAYNVTKEGNYIEEATREATGRNIPHLGRPVEEIAQELDLPTLELRERLRAARQALYEVRTQRVWPHLDDKIIAGWNGLAIDALAHAGRHLEEPRHIEAAERAAQFIITTLLHEGRLLRSWRNGSASGNGYLGDYAAMAEALVELHEATGKPNYLDRAVELAESILDHFGDEGAFYMTSDDHQTLIVRTRDLFDEAIPSGNGLAARVLVRLYAHCDNDRFARAAAKVLHATKSLMCRSPLATESLLLAADDYLDTVRPPRASLPGLHRVARDEREALTAELYTPTQTITPGQTTAAKVSLAIAEGYHIYANPAGKADLAATTVAIAGDCPFAAGEAAYPDGQDWTSDGFEEPVEVYTGQVTIEIPVTLPDDFRGDEATLAVELHYQPCTEHDCRRPETIRLEGRLEAKGG